jgi:hypothetical protein
VGADNFLSLVCEKYLVENSEYENFLFFEECDAVDGGWGVLEVEYVIVSWYGIR